MPDPEEVSVVAGHHGVRVVFMLRQR
jgi:hypothetical protein